MGSSHVVQLLNPIFGSWGSSSPILCLRCWSVCCCFSVWDIPLLWWNWLQDLKLHMVSSGKKYVKMQWVVIVTVVILWSLNNLINHLQLNFLLQKCASCYFIIGKMIISWVTLFTMENVQRLYAHFIRIPPIFFSNYTLEQRNCFHPTFSCHSHL